MKKLSLKNFDATKDALKDFIKNTDKDASKLANKLSKKEIIFNAKEQGADGANTADDGKKILVEDIAADETDDASAGVGFNIQQAIEQDPPFSDEERAKFLVQSSRFIAWQILWCYLVRGDVAELANLTRANIRYYKNHSTENLINFQKISKASQDDLGEYANKGNPFKLSVNYGMIKAILATYAKKEAKINNMLDKFLSNNTVKKITNFNIRTLIYLFFAEFILQRRDLNLMIKEYNSLANLFMEKGEINFVTAVINNIIEDIKQQKRLKQKW